MGEAPRQTKRHEAIAAELTEDITSGRFPVGGGFPVESELQERFSVGRHTVRMALGLLTEQGLIGRRRRVGTVVTSQRPIHRYAHSLRDEVGLSDFAQATIFEISRCGFVLNDGRMELLKFPDSPRRWARYAGVRYSRSDNMPLCWSEVLVPDGLAPKREDVQNSPDPMYQLLMKQQGFTLAAVEQEIQASQLSTSIAQLLNADPDSAALVVQRRYLNQQGFTFEVAINYYPAERYSIRSVLTPSTGQNRPSFADRPGIDGAGQADAASGYVMRFV